MKIPVTERALKYIAAVTMIIDHAPYIFPNAHYVYYTSGAVWFHAIGRIAAPIFFWFIARGYNRTRNFWRYALRIAIFAVITYVPFIYFLDGRMPNAENCLRFNVLFTMLAGLLLLRLVHEEKRWFVKLPCILLLCLAVTTADYGSFGLMFILAFNVFMDDKKKMAAAYTIVVVAHAFGSVLQQFSEYSPSQFADLLRWNALPGLALVILSQFLPLLLILAHDDSADKPRERSKLARSVEKWGFYAWYPAQFVILIIVRELFVR